MAQGEQMLRIGFDGRPLVEGEMRGLTRYTFELIRALRARFRDSVRPLSFSPEPIHPAFQAELELEQIVFRSRREILWEQYELPRQLRKHGVHLFHVTANRGLPRWKVCGYVLTVHDMIESMPEFVARGPLKSYLRQRYADAFSVHSADRIITVSQHSKRDICRHWKLPDGRVQVIYEAAAPAFFSRELAETRNLIRRKYSLPETYFLYVGGFDRKKNVGALVDAYARIAGKVPPLVLAGEQKWGFSEVHERVEALGLCGNVLMPGQIDNADLPALYQEALAFVYPSLYEGFGLQLVEAMASGTPVLASNRTSFPEVVGKAGLLFNPEDPREIANALEKIATKTSLRDRLREDGLRQAGSFCWQRTAEQTMEVYRSVAASGKVVSAMPQTSRHHA